MDTFKGFGIGILISIGVLLVSYLIVKASVDACTNCGAGALAPVILGAFALSFILPVVLVTSTYIGYKKRKKFILQLIIRLILGILLSIGLEVFFVQLMQLQRELLGDQFLDLFLLLPLLSLSLCMFLPEVLKNKKLVRMLPF